MIDEMTGTTFTTKSSVNASTRDGRNITVTPKSPPDFSTIEPEQATKVRLSCVFADFLKHKTHKNGLQLNYDMAARKWVTTSVAIKLDAVPFSKGVQKTVYNETLWERKHAHTHT